MKESLQDIVSRLADEILERDEGITDANIQELAKKTFAIAQPERTVRDMREVIAPEEGGTGYKTPWDDLPEKDAARLKKEQRTQKLLQRAAARRAKEGPTKRLNQGVREGDARLIQRTLYLELRQWKALQYLRDVLGVPISVMFRVGLDLALYHYKSKAIAANTFAAKEAKAGIVDAETLDEYNVRLLRDAALITAEGMASARPAKALTWTGPEGEKAWEELMERKSEFDARYIETIRDSSEDSK